MILKLLLILPFLLLQSELSACCQFKFRGEGSSCFRLNLSIYNSYFEHNVGKVTSNFSSGCLSCSHLGLYEGYITTKLFEYFPRVLAIHSFTKRIKIRCDSPTFSSLHLTLVKLKLSLAVFALLFILLGGDIESNPGPQSREESFLNSIKLLPRSSKSGIFTPEEIQEKISYLSSPRPVLKKDADKWSRIKSKYSIRTYQCSSILYLIETSQHGAKQVIPITELFPILNKFHKYEDDHPGRTKLYKRVSQQYHGITEQVCSLFVKTCNLCVLKKSRKSVKQPVYKPISSNSFGSRGQVDLIDMSSMNLAANLSPDGIIPYKFILVYIDHFTKKINLAPLIRKSAEEVCEVLLDIFCEQGPPHILHSDNGREFKNNPLFSTLAKKWPSVKIVHGKPRHPECQGAVERVNRDIKDALFTKMIDNENDQCWFKYLRWIKLHHNTSYHTTIKMSPYEAVYNRKPVFGLTYYGVPEEDWVTIPHEDDLNNYIEYVSSKCIIL